MSTHSPDAGQDEPNGTAPSKAASESLACNGCRRAKLRCSRDRPNCAHCRKTGLDCVYETKRVKPGLKAGAVENLHRRLDALEQLVLAKESASQTSHSTVGEREIASQEASRESAAQNVLALLAKELPKLLNGSATTPLQNDSASRGAKRRRLDDNEVEMRPLQLDDAPSLPDPELLETFISAYFFHIHPIIPMIHQARFRQRLADTTGRKDLDAILHSMIIAASKFIPDNGLSTPLLNRTRRWVVSTAMECLSLENLQALIIIAFTDIGDGNTAKAWPLIGSLTRTVEYCQLTQEHEDSDHQPFCQAYESLDFTHDWTEIEERRRIFWNIFNLDRFCSISMGWNTSLTSDDVHRRLPCDGHLWRKRIPVLTPYFGIWDKSAGRIGNPIAFLPHYQSPGQSANDVDLQSQADTASSGGQIQSQSTDMSTVGAFAYNIEATESMSRIMSYFLQQKINTRDQREINSWLTRFKELDLRLVHWKMLLPQKWKSNMERQSTLMDPNLTTAHVTHNASMILLHQLIAYPPVTWGFRNRLPSSCSVEACFAAGVEIATIAHNYLSNSQDGSPIGPQFTFCVFIAARILLIHWKYHGESEPTEEFWSLVRSLEEIARRWTGFADPSQQRKTLAYRYAARLKELYGHCQKDPSFYINVVDFNKEIDHSPVVAGMRRPGEHVGHSRRESFPSSVTRWASSTANFQRPMSTRNLAVPPSPQALVPSHVSLPSTVNHAVHVDDGVPNGMDAGDFNTIPQMMFDQHFMSNMDRVIAFDDGSMFAATLEHGAW
ncbi:hypothetical protein BS50DRAFT_556125 [Corynespora cassiicola Philippines]|uniref:Zn(2)-C6 fungal-type domain-containing protein n=1 Tax=Corynespora cassiicola Philippines TaxID=1448308 RepID=A0A2T2NJ58_CORCC|nr:hypothetical protein BS50DRAFT_556125 [Corynespora cassiicola Philippines]